MNFRLIILSVGILCITCDLPVDSPGYEEKLVVFGNITAEMPLVDTFYVSLSFSIDVPHETDAKWVDNAEVSINDGDTTIFIPPIEGNPGRYIVNNHDYTVMPNRTYSMEVIWQGDTVTAETTVPDTFTIHSISSDQWECDGEVIQIDTINLYQNVYDFDTLNDVIIEALVGGDFSNFPMDTIVYKEGDCYTSSFASVPYFYVSREADYEPPMMRLTSYALTGDSLYSNAIFDTSFSANAFKGPMYIETVDDTTVYYRPNPLVWNLSQPDIDMGWLAFNYYGPHLIIFQAADQDFRDYFEGDPLGQNQYILPNSNIDGGYGLFSSSYFRYFLVYVAEE